MCRGLSCILVSVFNSVLMVVGLLMAVFGGLLKWNKSFLETVLDKALSTVADKLTDDAKTMIDTAMTVLQDISGPLGLIIFILGIILIVFAAIGFVGVCCHVKCLLIIYAALLAAVILIHAIVIIVYFADKDIVLGHARDVLKKAVHNYKSVESQSVDSVFLAVLMPALKCCGYKNGEDFNAPGSSFTGSDIIKGQSFSGLKYPVPCCNLEMGISKDPKSCPTTFTAENSFFETGCGALSEKELENIATKAALYSLIAMAIVVSSLNQ